MLKHDSIRRCSIRGRTSAVRHWERELKFSAASAELHPVGLPRAAIVCIRSLRVMPRSLREGVWRGLETQLPQEIAAAERPALRRVSSGAKAIVFSDQAELLSCLARDWSAGELRAHWWWRSLLQGDDLDRLAKAIWLRSPNAVPAALHLLLTTQSDASFLRFFETAELEILFSRVVEAFGLTALPTVSGHRSDRERADSRIATGPTASPMLECFALPSGTRSLINRPTGRFSERRLVAVAAMLMHAPALVRSTAFADEFQRWEGAAREFDEGTVPLIPSEPTNGSGYSNDSYDQRDGRSTDARSPGHRLNRAETDAPDYRPFSKDRAIDAVEARRADADSPDKIPLPETEISSPQTWEPVDATTECPPYPLEERIDSPSAGLFYLVSVALSLGLYGDFTTPQNPGLDLPLWDFLELVGARLLGPTPPDDPLFLLLARLSQRPPDEPAGANFTPPHGLGITAWLDQTEKQIRDRLESALGVCGEELTTLVLRQRGTVCVTATRVDVIFFLAEHPIELRLSGLDRDPGWVPAAGRSIAFHYE